MHKRSKKIENFAKLKSFPQILKEKIKATENHRYENTKILLGIVICSIVALSHYYPSPFPENYYLIILCIIGFHKDFYRY